MRKIIIAWAENCSGPGWTNTPVWYIEKLPNGKLDIGCLQPEEQTKEMVYKFDINAMSSKMMTSLVTAKLNAEAGKEERMKKSELKEKDIKKLANNGHLQWLANNGYLQWLVENGYIYWLIEKGYLQSNDNDCDEELPDEIVKVLKIEEGGEG